ncbi:GntR family transcriptional regulator [Streptomyces sp. NPDC046805]|uniref:GntR family transcriptional regulator n=1 Tax=Streptomyces sp. NPDC046805 TaxID=3155134 RepID=UPI0033F8713F
MDIMNTAAEGDSLAEQTYRRLRSLLEKGEFATDSPLSEQSLARSLGVSRTPVREALARLTVDGLVAVKPNGTRVVADLWPNVAHGFAIRIRLEPWAAALSSQRMTADDFEDLKAMQEKMEKLLDASGMVGEISELNQLFHWRIITFCGSPPLIETLDRLRPYSVVPRIVEQYDDEVRRVAILEHRNIIDALWRRDSTETEHLTRLHLERGFETLKAAVARSSAGSSRRS